LSLFFGLSFSLPAVFVFADGKPSDLVDGLHAALLNNMKHAKEYGCDGRIKHLQPVIDASFDVPLIAQTVMRNHWKDLSDAQRSQLIEAFRDITLVTYASNFSGFNGETFTTQDIQSYPNGDQLVHTRLQPGSGDSVALDYTLRGKDGNFRIINVTADGVSDLALRSTQYNQLYEKKGFAGLLEWLQEQSKKMRANCG
jgi:phospholipid transport system substrate-binding protein